MDRFMADRLNGLCGASKLNYNSDYDETKLSTITLINHKNEKNSILKEIAVIKC